MTSDDLLSGLRTTSDKIRVLDAAGYPRAEIARLLGKLYQHVRNVLNDATPEQTARALAHVQAVNGSAQMHSDQGVEEAGRPWDPVPPSAQTLSAKGIVHLVVGPNGEVVLPRAVMAAFGLSPGSRVTAELKGETFTLLSSKENLARIQAMVRQFVPPGSPQYGR